MNNSNRRKYSINRIETKTPNIVCCNTFADKLFSFQSPGRTLVVFINTETCRVGVNPPCISCSGWWNVNSVRGTSDITAEHCKTIACMKYVSYKFVLRSFEATVHALLHNTYIWHKRKHNVPLGTFQLINFPLLLLYIRVTLNSMRSTCILFHDCYVDICQIQLWKCAFSSYTNKKCIFLVIYSLLSIVRDSNLLMIMRYTTRHVWLKKWNTKSSRKSWITACFLPQSYVYPKHNAHINSLSP